MKAEFVIQFLPRMMQERGHGDNYTVAYRDVVVGANKRVKIDAANMFFFFVEGFSADVVITSETGIYDLRSEHINEQQHEHTGEIVIENSSEEILHLEFIVAIIKNS